jgi:molybdopterin molybdotransferase
MRSTSEHLDVVLANATASEPLEVGLLGAVGCVLAEDVTIEDDNGTHTLLSRGTTIAARHIALIAAANLGRVMVHPKPRVVVLTVGSDLADPGANDESHPDINGIALTAAATAAGAMTFRVGPLLSDVDKVRASIEDQLVRADIIVAACGMSAGDYDLLTGVLRELGRVEFTHVAMQPGGAQGYGVIGPDSTPVFVLPGSPVGALLSFDVFVRPLIRRLMGHTTLHHKMLEATLDSNVSSNREETRYVRAQLFSRGGTSMVKSLEGDEQHPLSGLGIANALIVIPPGTEKIAQGHVVTVMCLDDSDE